MWSVIIIGEATNYSKNPKEGKKLHTSTDHVDNATVFSTMLLSKLACYLKSSSKAPGAAGNSGMCSSLCMGE